MKILATLELEDAITRGYTQLDQGIIIKLENNLVVFISENRIGVFSNESIDKVDGDFSKIPISKIHITSLGEGFTHDSGATLSSSKFN